MSRLLKLFFILGMLGLTAGGAFAQENPLEYLPENAAILIRLREPDQTMEKVTGLVNKVQPGAGDVIHKQQAVGLGQLISNPELTGVDQSRDWYAAVFVSEENAPQVVFAIPAVNPADVVSAIGDGFKSSIQKDWVLYTEGEALPQVERDAHVAARLKEAGLKTFTTGDLNIYLNAVVLKSVYGEQIKVGQDKILENLSQLRFAQPNQEIDMDAVVEMYGTIVEGVFQGIEDSQSAWIGASINESDLHFTKKVDFAAESPSASLLAKLVPDELPLLGKLPAGQLAYFGISSGLKEAIELSMKFARSSIKDEKQIQNLDTMVEKMKEVETGPMVGSVDIVTQKKGMFRVAAIGLVNPIEKYRDLSRNYVQSAGEMKTAQFDQTSTIQIDAETFGDLKGDVVKIKQEYHGDTEASALQKKMQEAMFGGEGIESRIVYLKDKYVTTMGGGSSMMANLLKSIESSTAKNSTLEKYRSQVMEKAIVLMFIDLPRLSASSLRLTTQLEQFNLPINGAMIDTLNLKPSYMAVAVGSEGNTFNSELRLPIETIIGMTKIGVMIGTAAQGGGGL